MSIVPARAESSQTIVVIDTGTNTSLFKNNIVYEVCLVTFGTCPNGKQTMEGRGAANLPATNDKNFNHGTQMMSIILQVNPAAKIIPIRIVGMSPTGAQGVYNLDNVQTALIWVVKNQTKFNIAAVSLSQGKVFKNCKVPTGMEKTIATLKKLQVPVLAAAGNDGNRTSVFSPACLPDTVSVGATDNPLGVQPIEYDKDAVPYIAEYNNGSTGQVDFYLNARYTVTTLDGLSKFTMGTSNSTAALAAWWVLNQKPSFDETFEAIMSATVEAKNEWITGRYVKVP